MEKRKIYKSTFNIVLFYGMLLFAFQGAIGQKLVLEPNKVTGEIHISKDNFPKGNIINMVNGWGGMTVAINEPMAGTDFTPILKGLKDDLCQVPHWGYLEKAKYE